MQGYLGEIRYFGGNFAPRGWSLCLGQTMSIAQYDALYVLLGTTYGGDGITTFNLPDFRGRVGVGAGTGPGLPNVVVGEMAGTETVTLNQGNLPAHTHVITNPNVTPAVAVSVNNTQASENTPANGMSIASAGYMASGAFVPNLGFNTATPNVVLNPGSLDMTIVIDNQIAGQSLPHENMQPYLTVNFIICIEGIFPQQNI